MKEITDLKNTQSGQCYIIGSGVSVGFIDKKFWNGKYKIGLNRIAKHIPCDIVVAKEKPIRFGSELLVLSEFEYGNIGRKLNVGGDYYFRHNTNKHEVIDFPEEPDHIVVSWSTVTSAMNLACYMGFNEIYLCGHDCGTIDGLMTISDYYDKPETIKDTYTGWLGKIEPQTIAVRDWLKTKYDVTIQSINPFVSLNMEGHTFK